MTRDLRHPPREVSEPHERFAILIKAERAAILTAYAKSLETLGSPIVAEPRVRAQAMRDGAEIITDVAASVQGTDIRAEDHDEMLAWMIADTPAGNRLTPADLLRATVVFFEVAVAFLTDHVRAEPGLLPAFISAVVALNESISRRIREATLAYSGFLLERVDQAHVDERRRIARDLHDQLGEGLSVALRQLELYELRGGHGPARSGAGSGNGAGAGAERAKNALTEAMRRLRVVTSDLRQETVRGLEKSLVQYLDSIATDARIRLRVSGDETWVPPTVIEEAFLIIREAIRNALTHGAPQLVLIGVTLAPHELRAWIDDNGRGFMLTNGVNPISAGTGLTSMRERAATVGGRLTLDSAPGQGTYVELLVPLSGQRDD